MYLYRWIPALARIQNIGADSGAWGNKDLDKNQKSPKACKACKWPVQRTIMVWTTEESSFPMPGDACQKGAIMWATANSSLLDPGYDMYKPRNGILS
jgi:hypothetical protein